VSALQQFVLWLIANGAPHSISALGAFLKVGSIAMRVNKLAGVQGISPGSSVAIYEGQSGERGVLCTQVSVSDGFGCICRLRAHGPNKVCREAQAIAESEVVFRIPLRLAITDFADDVSFSGLGVPESAHWAVRLATKLLLERARGASSPWYPYLQAHLCTCRFRSIARPHCTSPLRFQRVARQSRSPNMHLTMY